MTARPCVLVLAGLDPSGGAGLLADAEAIRGAGARALCVPTALTVQTTARALRFEPVAPPLVGEMARALFAEEDVRAVKIGMLGTREVARAVRDLLAGFNGPVVVDPVLASSSGAPLFAGAPHDAAAEYLELSRGRVVTPNLDEALVLTGEREPGRAAQALLARGANAAIVKGGHGDGEHSIDLLATALGVEALSAPRIAGTKRGTGCRFASALAAGLALGRALPDAARDAKDRVLAYLRA